MNVFVTLNVTSDHLEVSETVLSYVMETAKRELFLKKRSKLVTQRIWFQQQDVVAIWFAMALVEVDHVKLIANNHVMALLMMAQLTVTLAWPVKWIQTVLNVVLMLLLMNQIAFAISNVSDQEETVSWSVPTVVLILPLPPQLQPQPLLKKLQQLRPQPRPRPQPRQQLPPQQLQPKSVRDVGLLVTSIEDHQSDIMTVDGFGRTLMTTVVFLN